ncbi:MAG: hypothetical protein ABSC22_05915 [Roseiarcus sp.]|jgi:hypothetical protein
MREIPFFEIDVKLRLPRSLPKASRPGPTARRLATSPRQAALVSFGDIAELGAAYLEATRAPAQAALSPLMRAAAAYEAACAAAEAARFTAGERGAALARRRAFDALLSLLGIENGDATES